jgi:hypothetical protein
MKRSLKRARIEQKTKALQLLTLSGAIRTADIETRYRGSETVLGIAARPQREMPREQQSIWWMDLTSLLKALQIRQSSARSRQNAFPNHVAARSVVKRRVAPRAA